MVLNVVKADRDELRVSLEKPMATVYYVNDWLMALTKAKKELRKMGYSDIELVDSDESYGTL